MNTLHRLFKALADPNRLRILNLLLNKPLCVCELGSILDLPQSLVSRHLAHLRAEGLVADQRHGMRVQYSLTADGPLAEAIKTFLQRAFSADSLFRDDLLKCEQGRRECCTPTTAARRKRAASSGRSCAHSIGEAFHVDR